MKKFTNINKENTNIEKKDHIISYKGDYLNVVKYKDYEFVEEPHMVVILPYLRDEGFVLLRHEDIPTYQYHYSKIDNYKQITHFLTVISGTIEKDENMINTVRRELYEEAGIVLSSMYQIEMDKHVFLNKSNVAQYHTCILELRYNDYKVTTPPTDGSQSEKNSRTIKISLGDLNELKTHDLITEYMLTKFKLEYKLK